MITLDYIASVLFIKPGTKALWKHSGTSETPEYNLKLYCDLTVT